nr:DUF4270 family protein [Saprospiraceae bacterium]
MFRYLKSLQHSIYIWLVLALLIGACNDPSFVGSDLLEDDIIDYETTENFDFDLKIAPSDSVAVFDLVDRVSTHRIGQVYDPYFGTTRAALAVQLLSETPALDTSEVIVIDSVVLSMVYDLEGFYGDTLLPMGLEVYRLLEFYDPRSEVLYSDHSYPTSASPIGTKLNFTPKPRTPIIRQVPNEENGTDTVQLAPQIRIPLDHSIGEELLSLDSVSLMSDSVFVSQFPGIFITPTAQNGSLMGVHTTSRRTVLTVFYTGDGTSRSRSYITQSNWIVGQTYSHDYTGAEVESKINESQNEELVVQGLTGLGTRINIHGLEQLEGKLINQARLRVFLNKRTDLPESGIFPEIPIFRLLKISEVDNQMTNILDVIIELNQGLSGNFGGRLQSRIIEGDTLAVYDMNITSHLQEILKQGKNPTLFLQSNNNRDVMGNTRAFGPGNLEHPMELRVVYTNR